MGSGLPLGTAQKPQRRVQRLPSIMKVAVLWFQHSPMLGQWADSQTVWRLRSRASFLRAWKVSPMGARAESQAGLGAGLRGVRSIWISASDWTSGAIGSIDCRWFRRVKAVAVVWRLWRDMAVSGFRTLDC